VNRAISHADTRRIWIDHSSEIFATADTVSALLADIDGWPKWTPGLSAVVRNRRAPARVGQSFLMMLKFKGAPFSVPVPCVLFTLSPSLIEWGGGLGTGTIRHSFGIQALGAEHCRVRHLEYATGWLAWLTRPIEKLAYGHDLAWSRALEKRFAQA
jgi:hypothetical protein